MEERIRAAIEEHGMLLAYKKVVIGFSGGADSSALLHYFKDKASAVLCVHINHMIRGDEAQRDEDFCRRICEKYGVELVVEKIDIPAIAKQRGTGLEETARAERYRVLNGVLDSRGFDAVLTAHNANDNAESVIFNLARGSGANGISGIKAVNGRIMRPLIYTTREQILEYCRKNGIEYVSDSTNDSVEYTRNFIRHKIVPLMAQINPSFNLAVSRLTMLLRSDEDYITSQARAFVDEECHNGKIPPNKASALHDSVRARVLKILCGENLDSTAIMLCKDFLLKSKCGDVVNLCKGISLKREKDYAIFIKTEELGKISFEQPLVPGLNRIEKIGVTIAYMTDEEPNCAEPYLTLYLKDIKGTLVARSRRDGDTIRHGKMTKKLKKLFMQAQIPSHQRDRIPLVCDENGIVAVPGVALRDGAKGTKEDIILKFYR